MQENKPRIHEPVLTEEVLDSLHIQKSAHGEAKYIDATVDGGGHAIELLKAGAKVLGIDTDRGILEIAKKRLEAACPVPPWRDYFKLTHGNFRNIDKIARDEGFLDVDGVLFDLGVSSFHYRSGRGFSFENQSEPLDMRFNPDQEKVTAADLLNSLRKDQLVEIFSKTLSRNSAAKIAEKVLAGREETRIKTVGGFLDLLKGLEGKSNLHPATLPFLALRMAVNSELENLEEALPKAFLLLKTGGRLVVISFHSGEDRIVKNFFKELKKSGLGIIETKRPIIPSESEIKRNPSSRSAKLRVIRKIKNE